MAFNKKLKAWVRYDGNNRVVAGSLILQPNQPKVGKWKELSVYKCCTCTSTFDLPLFLSRMNSCYEQATILVPRIVYFTDEANSSVLGPFTNISDGCDDMYDVGNFYNTNLTQLYADAKEEGVDYDLSIPYTHTQDDNDSNCSYTNPPMDGTIVNGSSYFGSGSTYFTNMYPGMFIIAATCVNVTEFSITGDLGSDGAGIDAVYIATAHPGWTAFIKTNYDDDISDPSINHIILVYGDVSGATQLYDNTGTYDDHCVQGLGPQNNTIITAVVATEADTPALTEEEALAIANRILDVYENSCVSYTLRLLFDDMANADTLVGDASNVADWNTYFDLPAYGNPFTSVTIFGNEVQLTGGSNIEVKFRLFNDYDHLLEVNDDGALVILGDESFGGSGATSSLTSIIAPNVTTTIGDSSNYGVFGNCYNLINAYLPNCVNLGAVTFYECEILPQSGLTLPFDQITIIESYTFDYCYELTEIDYPLVTAVGVNAFEYCSNVTFINLPLTVSIDGQSFWACTSLTSINIPNLISAGPSCFDTCSAATTFNFPLATILQNGQFNGCSSVTTFNLSSCTTLGLGGCLFNNLVFDNITGNTITLTVPAALMTCNAGGPDADIAYLQANNTVTVITV